MSFLLTNIKQKIRSKFLFIFISEEQLKHFLAFDEMNYFLTTEKIWMMYFYLKTMETFFSLRKKPCNFQPCDLVVWYILPGINFKPVLIPVIDEGVSLVEWISSKWNGLSRGLNLARCYILYLLYPAQHSGLQQRSDSACYIWILILHWQDVELLQLQESFGNNLQMPTFLADYKDYVQRKKQLSNAIVSFHSLFV